MTHEDLNNLLDGEVVTSSTGTKYRVIRVHGVVAFEQTRMNKKGRPYGQTIFSTQRGFCPSGWTSEGLDWTPEPWSYEQDLARFPKLSR